MCCPEQKYICPDCHNDGFKYCPTCEGRGEIEQSEIPVDIITEISEKKS